MSSGPYKLHLLIAAALLVLVSGCAVFIPETSQQPIVHNPFPQLSRVAVAPFFNQSDEPTVDGRKFAMAYFTELQDIPGFEVVPVGVVEEVMRRTGIDLSGPDHARRLAQILGVDAVVIGTVTDYSPYYPPRCGMRVEWYAANPGFHEVPAGYGLPWGTPLEEYIPDELVFEAEFALAREQLKTQTPDPHSAATPPLMPLQTAPHLLPTPAPSGSDSRSPTGSDTRNGSDTRPPAGSDSRSPAGSDARSPAGSDTRNAINQVANEDLSPVVIVPEGATVPNNVTGPSSDLPVNWPDARGFSPPGPSPVRPPLAPNFGPVMTHTRVYRGNDPEFTAALASYVSFRDEARYGGWQSYLERSDDFIRFCAHLHLAEMLTARGGGGETRVVRHHPLRR